MYVCAAGAISRISLSLFLPYLSLALSLSPTPIYTNARGIGNDMHTQTRTARIVTIMSSRRLRLSNSQRVRSSVKYSARLHFSRRYLPRRTSPLDDERGSW